MRVALQVDYRLLVSVGDDDPVPIVLTRDALEDLRAQIDAILQPHTPTHRHTHERAYVAPDDPRPADGQWNDEDDATLWKMVNAERDYGTIAMLLGHSVNDCQDRYGFLARGGNQ